MKDLDSVQTLLLLYCDVINLTMLLCASGVVQIANFSQKLSEFGKILKD